MKKNRIIASLLGINSRRLERQVFIGQLELDRSKLNFEQQLLDFEKEKLKLEQLKYNSLAGPIKLSSTEESKLKVDQDKIVVERERLELEKEKVAIEQNKSKFEGEKIALEREKLEFEKEKLANNLAAAEIGAKSRRYAAHTRAFITLITALGAAATAYLYFRPLEDKMKESDKENVKLKKDLTDMKSLFFTAEIESEKRGDIIKKAEELIGSSKNKAHIDQFNDFKATKEKEQASELIKANKTIVLDGLQPSTNQLTKN
jgi:hypothetical protein